MAINRLELPELVTLFGAFVDPKHLAGTIAAIAEVAPLAPQIAEVHTSLLRAQPAAEPGDRHRLGELQREQKGTDTLHDHALRALYHLMTARIEHLLAQAGHDEAALAQRLEQIRDAVFPDGLSMAQMAYPVEAGNAARAAQLVEGDKATRDALADIKITAAHSALDVLALWASLGARLASQQTEKNALRAQQDPGDKQPAESPTQVRNRAVSLLATVQAVLRHSHGPAVQVKVLRDAIATAASAASARYLARRSGQPAHAPALSEVTVTDAG